MASSTNTETNYKKKIDDKLLIAVKNLQANSKDSQAFEEVYNATSSYVFAKCRSLMNEEEDALDLMQETYLAAIKSISSLEKPENIFAWLGAIAYRQGMNQFRKKKDLLIDEEGQGIFDEIKEEHIERSPELFMDQQEVSHIISDIIEKLPPLQRDALLAFYYDDLKIDQIADLYQCSSNTIKSRLNYARNYVREQVELREKKDGIKLRSSSLGGLILLGLISMLGQEKYTLAPATAASVKAGIIEKAGLGQLGIQPTASHIASSKLITGLTCGLAGLAAVGGVIYGISKVTNTPKDVTTPIITEQKETEAETESETESETETETETETESETVTEAETETEAVPEVQIESESNDATESTNDSTDKKDSSSSDEFSLDSPDLDAQ